MAIMAPSIAKARDTNPKATSMFLLTKQTIIEMIPITNKKDPAMRPPTILDIFLTSKYPSSITAIL